MIIPVYGRLDLTRRCLERLLRHDERSSYEIVVSDDGSPDETPGYLASLGSRVRLVRSATNRGYASACNSGAMAARGGDLLFLNNDALPFLGWLDALVEELDAERDVMVVGSRLVFPDGRIQHAGVVFSKARTSPYHALAGLPFDDARVNRRRELRAVTGACMLVRRSAWEAHGGFDTSYRNGFEDIDLCLRIGDAGGRVVYQPRSALVHLESQSPGRHDHDLENLRRYRERWDRPWRADEDVVLAEHGLGARYDLERGRIRIAPLDDPSLRDWPTLAEAQRVALGRDRAKMRGFLRASPPWPEDPVAREWGERLFEWAHEAEPLPGPPRASAPATALELGIEALVRSL